MNSPQHYTPFHPKWYRKPTSTWWWLKRGAYLRFILREVSSVFIAWFVVVTLLQIHALDRGQSDYIKFQSWMASPWVLLVNVISFLFVMFHAISWFNLAPKAMVVHFRGKPVPGWWIAAANYGAWIVASAIIAWAVLRG